MPYYSPNPPVPISELPFHEQLLNAIDRTIADGVNPTAFINAEDPKKCITFVELRRKSLAVATYLYINGFKKDVAAIVLPNMWQYAAFLIGCGMNGGTVSGASALFTDYELQRQFVDSRAKVVLTSEEFLPKVSLAVKQSPNIEKIIVIPKQGNTNLPPGVVCWDEVVATPFTIIPKVPIDVYNDVLALTYSSGTTGSPKGVMTSHYNLSAMAAIRITREKENNLDQIDRDWDNYKENTLLFLPFYHCYGFGLLCHSILKGTTGIIMKKFNPITFLTSIQNYKIRMLSVVPPICVFLAKSPLCDNYDLSSMRMFSCGAAPAGKDLIDDLKARYPNLTFFEQGYGMTELTMASHFADLSHPQPHGSVGRLGANLAMKIVEPGTTDKEQPINQRGEICVRGPTVMLGYLGRPEATASTVIDGWLHTGDIGYLNEDGNLFIVDRLKELIKVKGLQVPPAELEDLLLSHPKIRDCAVIGIPDAKAGELPKAFVVRADNSLTEEDVKEFVKPKVSTYKRLEGGVEFLEEIPKSAAGKILRRFLRDRSLSKL